MSLTFEQIIAGAPPTGGDSGSEFARKINDNFTKLINAALTTTIKANDIPLDSELSGLYGGLTSVHMALKNSVKKDTIVVLTSGTSWTPPRANMLIDVWLIGGGGAGGNGGGVSKSGAGGGGGYARYLKDYKITSVTPIPISIGAGGVHGAANGNPGGTTSFGEIIARGGSGGNYYNNGGGGAGGAGGGGATTSATGAGTGGSGWGRDGGSSGTAGGIATTYTEFGSFCPINNTLYGGGGGGGAVSSTVTTVGGGGAGGAGGGGNGSLGNAAGVAGTLYGAGGGGAGDYTAGAYGGDGYQGVIIIGYNS